jgi:hypothetical protein
MDRKHYDLALTFGDAHGDPQTRGPIRQQGMANPNVVVNFLQRNYRWLELWHSQVHSDFANVTVIAADPLSHEMVDVALQGLQVIDEHPRLGHLVGTLLVQGANHPMTSNAGAEMPSPP